MSGKGRRSRHLLCPSWILTVGMLACSGGTQDKAEGPRNGPAVEDVGENLYDIDSTLRLTLVEELRLGGLDDPAMAFGILAGVDVDDEGKMYVWDPQAARIFVYTADGTLVDSFGRRGPGPGEFGDSGLGIFFNRAAADLSRILGVSQFWRGPGTFGVHGDTLWIFEGMSSRLTAFRLDGQLLSSTPRLPTVSVPLFNPSACTPLIPHVIDTEGYLLSFPGMGMCASIYEADEQAVADTVRLPLVRYDVSGTIVDTLTWYALTRPPDDVEVVDWRFGSYALPQPPSDEPLVVPISDGFYRVERYAAPDMDAGTFAVTRSTFSDDTVFSREFRYTPRPYSESALDSAAARAVRGPSVVIRRRDGSQVRLQRNASDSMGARSVILRRMNFPMYQAPVTGFHIGDDGALWLRRERIEGEPDRWLLIRPNGTIFGEFQLPAARARIMWSSGDRVILEIRDRYDVPWLIVYRIS